MPIGKMVSLFYSTTWEPRNLPRPRYPWAKWSSPFFGSFYVNLRMQNSSFNEYIIVLRLLIWSKITPISQCPYCPNAYHQNETGKFKKHLFNHEHVTKTALPHECIQCGKQDFCLQRLQKHIDNFRGPCHNNQCTQCHDFFKSHQDYKVSFNKFY